MVQGARLESQCASLDLLNLVLWLIGPPATPKFGHARLSLIGVPCPQVGELDDYGVRWVSRFLLADAPASASIQLDED